MRRATPFHHTTRTKRGVYRQLALLLIAGIISGLLQPLLPAPAAAAQARSLSAQAPAQALKEPVALTTAASTSAQSNLFNVSVGKKAIQTNDNPFIRDPYPGGAPANAIDGNTDGMFGNGSSATTWGNNHDPNDWWQVDLGGVYPITRVDLWNRTDCCAERLRDVYVLVSDTPFSSNVLSENLAQPGVSAYLQSGVLGRTTNVAIGRNGRFVRVVLSARGMLTLAEVQVWSTQQAPTTPSTDPINIAEGRAAVQSATNYGGTADRAVDGYVSGYYPAGSVTFAGGSATPDWWQVDLGGIYPIDTIDVWNRTDCCGEYLRDFHVFVSDTPFPSNDPAQIVGLPTAGNFFTAGPAGQRTTLTVGRTGRYIRVALSKPGILMLAEVQVWTKQRTPLGTQAAEPMLVAWPRNGEMYLTWPKVVGATSYNLQRASNAAGPFSLIATGIAQPFPTMPWYQYTDKPLTNDVFAYYVVTALDSAGRVVNRSEVLKAKPTTTATTSFDAYQPIPATSYTAAYAMVEQNDSVLGRPVMNGRSNAHNLVFHNVGFGTASANGVSLRYRANAPGTVQLVAQPANLVIGTMSLTTTNGLWRDANVLITPTSGVQSIYVLFNSQGPDSVQLDRLQFSKPGPFDTATLKWDPNIVLLHKSMGIALDSYLLDQTDMTMLMRFSTTTTQGRGQFALLKAGSVIASDTNLDLGGPYARVTQVVSINDSQVAVKAAALVFNDLIYAGSFDAKAAIQQSVNAAMDAAVGTSAKGPAFSAAGYNTSFPTDITYYNGPDLTGGQGAAGGSQSFRQQTRTSGLSSYAAQSSTPGVPTVLPPEARYAPKGTFHVTMDNAQFVKDENGWGIELINVKMNGLGIQPLPPKSPTSNPIASQFGFGVLGGVGAEKLMIQAKVEVDKGVISRNEMFSVKTQVTGTARFQAKGLAVALWFWELPLKWVKPIRFVVPTAVGPIPCSISFGVQGFIMAVGAGGMVAEKGYQVKLTQGGPPGKEVQVSDYGETKLEFGQKVDNVSLFGLFFEPYVKLRVGTFGLEEADPAVVQQLLGWMGHWVKTTAEQLKKMEGFFVFTFTPRFYYMLLLQNWKDKDRPIHEQKVCVGPVVKAEALPGFPLPMTFEFRLEGPPYCFGHETWLQYDMETPEGVLIDPNTGKGKATWGVPIISEHSRIPYDIRFERGFPYSEPGAPQVLSTNIADAWFNAAERRRCLIFRKPLSQSDTVDIAYSGPCKTEMTTEVQLPADRTEAIFMLRVLTEYRHPIIASDAELIRNEYVGGGSLPWGIWSDKSFVVARPNNVTGFQVNGTEVFSDSAPTMEPILGVECDPEGRRALGMILQAQIGVVDPSLTLLEEATLLIDGLDVDTSTAETPATSLQLQSAAINLSSGPHTLTIIAKQKSLLSNTSFSVRYSATFKAQAKACGRAKPDNLSAVLFEGSPKCPRNESPEVPLDVLINDDWTGEAKLTITGVGAAKLGTVRIGEGGQTLRYKPSGVGVDSFTYTVTIVSSDGQQSTATANVLVTNRLATTDEDCAGGGGGGGSGGGNPNKRGKVVVWGDPHITTADGLRFDSHAFGEFVYYQPKAGKTGLTLHGRQEPWSANRAAALMTALAFTINGHTVEFRARKTQKVLVDGKAPAGNTIDLGNGTTLVATPDQAQLVLPNARIDVQIGADYLNLTMDLPLDNTYQGMLGSPNDNPSDDWILLSGAVVTDAIKLADGWRITDRTKSLFTYDAGEGPETYNRANIYLGELPTPEQLAASKAQALNLLTTTCDTGGVAPDATEVEAMALDLYLGARPETIASRLCTYEVKGVLTSTNPAGAPIAGATVEVLSSQTQRCYSYTSSNGAYRCKLEPLMGGSAPTVQLKVNGAVADTFTFASKAPIHGTLSLTRNLSITLPSVRLTVRTLDAAGTPAPNTTVEVRSANVTRQITTGPDATAALVLSYPLNTTSASIDVRPLGLAYGYINFKTVALSASGPVDLTIETKHILLGAPAWVRAATSTGTTNTFSPMVSETAAALGADGTIYTIGRQNDPNGKPFRLVATNPNGTPKWVSVGFGSSEPSIPSVGPDGVIYLLARESTNAKLYAFNPDGSLKWSFATPTNYTYISQVPAVGADGRVYFVAAQYNQATAKVYGISQANGSVAWSYDLAETFQSRPGSPVLGANGTLYFAGARLWSFAADGTVRQSTFATYRTARIAIGPDGTLYLTEPGDPEGGSGRTLAVNPDLTLRWSIYIGSYYPAAIAPDGSVYLPSAGLIKLNPATGATVWTWNETVQGGPVIAADGTVYVMVASPSVSGLPSTGQLVGVRPDGTVASRFTTRSGYGSFGLKMAPGGRIYATMRNPNNDSADDLYAITTSATGPATGWSSAFGNPQNTNRRSP